MSVVAVIALLTALASCAPPQPNYMPPPNLTLQTGASIVGSRIIDPSPFVPNTKADLLAVDNQNTALGVDGWKTPTMVSPGSHTLIVSICRGNLLAGDYLCYGDITLLPTVKPGGTYTIRTTVPTGFTGFERHFVTVWVEDGTGAAITPKTKFEMDGSNPPIVQMFEH